MSNALEMISTRKRKVDDIKFLLTDISQYQPSYFADEENRSLS
jgi:hemerythrin